MPLLKIKRHPLPAALALAFLPAISAHADVTNLGSVQAQGSGISSPAAKRAHFESRTLSAKQKQKSTQPVKSVSKQTIDLYGPDGGGMQALGSLPNVNISSYNATSASSRSTISLRGVKVGWNSVPGDLETNGITAELDGVPLNSLSQGTGWHSPEIPLGALMSGINVVEGPGDAKDRWYNSLGGTINFIPVQPTRHAHTRIDLSVGSFHTNVISGVHNTGEINGWSTVLGFASARSQSIRSTPDSMPSKSTQLYLKTRKQLENGSLSFGAYAQRNDEFRPNMIPVIPNPEIHIDGLNGTGPLYSEQTSGYYATLPRSVWFKDNAVENYMAWSRLRLALSSDLDMTNMFWIRNGNLRHYRVNNFNTASPNNTANTANPANVEWFTEHSNTFGDKLDFAAKVNSSNTLGFGGYWINSRAQSDYLGYDPALGTSIGQPANIGYSNTFSSYWAAYLQDTFKPTSNLTIVPGIRFVSFQTDFTNTSPTKANTLYGGNIPASVGYDTNPNQSSHFNATEPSIGMNWLINDSLAAFANYAVARRNPTAGNYDRSADLSTLKLVKARTYDFGLRYVGRHVAGLHRLNASIEYFHTMMDNQTIPQSISGNPSYRTNFTFGASTLKGIDLQADATVDSHWSGFANVGWLHSNWNSFYNPGSNTYYNGLPVSNSPNLTANAGITYRHFISTGTIDTTLWDQYIGHQYLWDNLNGAPTTQESPGHNLLNLAIKMQTTALNSAIPGVQLTTVSLNVLNLLNKKYNSTAYISSGGYFQTSSGGYVIANPGAPRSVYLSLSANF
ncbi:MAG: TonB-dependent receptor [Betaproteobacteria bacterium]|nr:TonB-dependent receptor [Betaproteobacteria bacterium]MDE2122393.1 TonB-dependent receptor [Betaproteobacteria bacterium]MDE2186245.1 TonB-dependent receptor [Betaproteobacteria bacterium]MDE2325107.1 TonB-dependent receptor [Betaproteobacteria bacterium]